MIVSRSTTKAFSLVELMVSMSILLIMLAAAAGMLSQSQKTLGRSVGRVSQFRDARLAFELISRNLSQSTLNTYWDYVLDSADNPTGYGRQSELQFFAGNTADVLSSSADSKSFPTHSVFFQAVLGETNNADLEQLNSLLNGRGYFIEFGDDSFLRPKFIEQLQAGQEQRQRFRLMEFRPPTENNQAYRSDHANSESGVAIETWFSLEEVEEFSRPVVENVIALIISPQISADSNGSSNDVYDIAPDFEYNSRDDTNEETLNVLPPLVEITLVAITEQSAIKLQEQFGQSPPNDLIESQWFQQASDIEKDLQELEDSFNARGITYRLFTTKVAIRSAKWSP